MKYNSHDAGPGKVKTFVKAVLFLLGIGLVLFAALVAGLRHVGEQNRAQQEAVRQQWVQSGPYIVIDHGSEILADGAISVAFARQCPDISVIESDPYGVAYSVSFRRDYMRGLEGKQGNMSVSHEGVVIYAGSGSLQTLANKACSAIKGQQH